MNCDGEGNIVPVVYKVDMDNVLLHTARFTDRSKLAVHNSYLQILYKPYVLNMTTTLLDYSNEVGSGISLEKVQDLARPSALSPLQQYLISWNILLYQLP